MYIDGWVWHGSTVDIFLLPEWESVYVPAHSPRFNMEDKLWLYFYMILQKGIIVQNNQIPQTQKVLQSN